MAKETVLLTGASGSMGGEAFRELLHRRSKYNVRLLAQPIRSVKKKLVPYQGEPGVEIIWGDLTNPDDVLRALDGVDCVLHPAALIPPAADHNPGLAREINVSGTKNVIAAIRRQPNHGDNIRFVSIGSVAQYGDRLPPHEMIKVGDPLKPSVHDYYGLTKCEAERAVIDSGLKYWASIRQTYIAIPNAITLMDPILFHQPLNSRIELITRTDAGYGLVQSLEAPEDFWGRIYNMSGGPSCRVVYIDYLIRMIEIFGLGNYHHILDRNWFALKNFHCGYFEDSEILNGYLGHARETLEDHYRQVEKGSASWMKIGARLCPRPLLKWIMRRMADPLRWIHKNNEPYISAFFGSREAWKSIPDWDEDIDRAQTNGRPVETLADAEIGHETLQAFAKSRGGQCLSGEFSGERNQHRWRCARSHEFEASPTLLIRGGYWCPECGPRIEDPSHWDWDAEAENDSLLAKFQLRN